MLFGQSKCTVTDYIIIFSLTHWIRTEKLLYDSCRTASTLNVNFV